MQFSFHAAVAASSSVWIEENDQLPRPHQLDYVSTKSEKIHIISHLFVNFFNRANLMTHLKSIHQIVKISCGKLFLQNAGLLCRDNQSR